jgi:hypothetical protein
MCEECVELDRKIEHYGRLASRITDQALCEKLKELIDQLLALKVALHQNTASRPLSGSKPESKSEANQRGQSPIH